MQLFWEIALLRVKITTRERIIHVSLLYHWVNGSFYKISKAVFHKGRRPGVVKVSKIFASARKNIISQARPSVWSHIVRFSSDNVKCNPFYCKFFKKNCRIYAACTVNLIKKYYARNVEEFRVLFPIDESLKNGSLILYPSKPQINVLPNKAWWCLE